MTTTAFTDAETIDETVRSGVTARLTSDLRRYGARGLAPEDAWDVEALVEDIVADIREVWALTGTGAIDWSVDGIGLEWRGLADAHSRMPWVTCGWGCTAAADGGYIPCAEHADAYRAV